MKSLLLLLAFEGLILIYQLHKLINWNRVHWDLIKIGIDGKSQDWRTSIADKINAMAGKL